MAQLTPVTLSQNTGLNDIAAQLVAASGGGDSYFMNNNEVFVALNGSGGSITITIAANKADNFGIINAAHNITLAVTAGKWGFIPICGLFRWPDTNGLVQVTYSGVTSLTVGVFRFPMAGA